MSPRRSTFAAGKIKSSASFLLAMVLITLVWGWCLPQLAQHRTVNKRLEFLDQRGIDPSAMFYTELDAMEGILDRLENGDGPAEQVDSSTAQPPA